MIRFTALRVLSAAFAVAALAGLTWGLGPAQQQPARHSARAEARKAKAPVTDTAMTRQLAALFQKTPFTQDRIHVQVKNQVIRLTGSIVLAEDRGRATQDARHAAAAAHWKNYRVVNTLRVQ